MDHRSEYQKFPSKSAGLNPNPGQLNLFENERVDRRKMSTCLSRGPLTRLLRIRHCPFNQSQIRCTSTVNDEEIKHFDRLAADWWDPRGSSRLLHRMNPLRISFIKSLIQPQLSIYESGQWLKGYKVLDVGCGGGILAESLSRLGATVDALDASSRAIDVAKAHLKKDPTLSSTNPPNYICGSIQEHKNAEKYDIVTAMEVLEHVDYPSTFIDEVVGQVKPEGWLVMSTVARTWQSWLGAIVAAERILNIVPPGTHSWDKFINESELREYIQKLKTEAGEHWVEEIKSIGSMYNPLKDEWVFVDTKSGVGFNYFLAARRGK